MVPTLFFIRVFMKSINELYDLSEEAQLGKELLSASELSGEISKNDCEKESESFKQKGFPVMGNATLFIVPFHYGEENEEQDVLKDKENYIVREDENSLWIKENKMLTNEGDGSVIYPHIMSFLQGQMMDTRNSETEHLIVYSIADIDRRGEKETKNEQRTIIKKFWNKFVQSEHTVEVGTKECSTILRFRFNNGKHATLKPHLFLSPSARIGLLTFGVELTTNNSTSKDLMLLNYHLHKIAEPISRCVCLQLSISGDEECQIRKEATYRDVRGYIGEHISRVKKQNTKEEYKEFSWNMKTLVHMMLKDVRGVVFSETENKYLETAVELFTPPRIHVFTYCGIDDSLSNYYSKEDIYSELYRLSRCVNDKYLLPFEEINKQNHFLQTFDNVYASSTVEGTAFIAIAKEQNRAFFDGFASILALRYVWIYLLAMIQRYSLLNMDRMLIELETDEIKNGIRDEERNIQKHNKMLWRLLDVVRQIKVHCHYTDVSPFTQHNEFYEHCCDKLHINSAFNEIDHKTKVLNLTMSHDLQVLQEQKEMAQKKREERLNMFLAILASLQAIGVIHELLDALLFQRDMVAVIIYLSLIMISIVIIFILYKKQAK